jgi:hypothetical protein
MKLKTPEQRVSRIKPQQHTLSYLDAVKSFAVDGQYSPACNYIIWNRNFSVTITLLSPRGTLLLNHSISTADKLKHGSKTAEQNGKEMAWVTWSNL